MGEVVEMCIVSKEKNLLHSFLNFMLIQMRDNDIKEVIEVMNNWQYEGVEVLGSTELVKTFIGNKIVCITEIGEKKRGGISIEPINGSLVYNLWFDSDVLSSKKEYLKLINDFIIYIINNKVIDNIIIGAIGKEIVFEYLSDNIETINNAHNIDIWIIDKINLHGEILCQYKLFSNVFCDTQHKNMQIISKI